MIRIIAISALVCLFVAINGLNKCIIKSGYKIVNPISIITIIWSLVLIMHWYEYKTASYTYYIYLVAACGLISFAVGFWTTAKRRIVFLQIRRNTYGYDPKALNRMMSIFTMLDMVRMVYFVILVYRIAGSLKMFFSQNTYVRNIYLARPNTLTTYFIELPLSVLSMIGFVVLGIYAVNRGKKGLAVSLLWLAIETIIALTTMSKLNLFIFLFVVVYTILNNIGTIMLQKAFFKKYLPIIAAMLFAFLILIVVQRNYKYTGSIYRATVKSTINYFTCGFEAFGVFFEKYLSGEKNITKFVDVGGGSLTNIFTWYRAFINHFWFFGIFIPPCLIGALAGLFYSYPNKGLFAECANSWVGCVVFMSFYSFLWTHNSYLLCLVVGYMIDLTAAKKLYLKDEDNKL